MRRWINNPLAGTLAGAVLLFMLAAPEPVDACAFHTYVPERTAIDWVIDSRELILARPDPEDEFSYVMVERLNGRPESPDLPFLVDSVNRRRLAANPSDSVLFALGDDGRWEMVAYVDNDLRAIIDTVLSKSGSWKKGYNRERFALFEGLQDHSDPALRSLALREIDRAPYELLKEIDLRIPVEELRANLWTLQGYPYQPIRILLLGLSGSDVARTEIHGFMERAADRERDRVSNLGAFATALIELDGPSGITRLEETFLANTRQPLHNLEQVVEALAIHNGVGSRDLRNAIDAALKRFLDVRPEGAPLVARQFSSRGDWSQAGRLQKILGERHLHASVELLPVAVYVAQARRAYARGLEQTPVN